MILREPQHQRTACVQRKFQMVVWLEDIQERQITVLVCLFDNSIEVAMVDDCEVPNKVRTVGVIMFFQS